MKFNILVVMSLVRNATCEKRGCSIVPVKQHVFEILGANVNVVVVMSLVGMRNWCGTQSRLTGSRKTRSRRRRFRYFAMMRNNIIKTGAA
jgi:hypothetical protein